MSRPPNQHSKALPPPAVRDVPLVIKDSLREIRFSATMGAKRWMQEMEGVLSHIPKVGPTLGAATKTAPRMSLLQRVRVVSVSGKQTDAQIGTGEHKRREHENTREKRGPSLGGKAKRRGGRGEGE